MDKQHVKLQEYFIILKKDHAEIGLSTYRLKQYHPIENDDLVVITTEDKSVYEEVFKWLNNAYYWRKHNAYFSHHSKEHEAWFSIENGCVITQTGSI